MSEAQPRTCPGCGKNFKPSHGGQKFCDGACRNRVNSRRWREGSAYGHSDLHPLVVPVELTEEWWAAVRADFIDAMCGAVLKHGLIAPTRWTTELERAA